MAMLANYEFLFVGRDDDSFLENYAYDLFEEHGSKGGQIFVNLEIKNNSVDAEDLATAIFDTMSTVFFEDIEMEPYERFEMSLKAVNDVLKEFKEEKLSGFIGDLHVVIAAIVGDKLFLTQSGEAEAYLIRKRYVSLISDGLDDGVDVEKGDLFVNIASGRIEPGDFVLFSSTRLLRYIGKNDLAKSVRPRSVEETLADIREMIYTETLGRIGLTGVLFNRVNTAQIKQMEGMESHATETLLEASDGKIISEKEMVSGEFVTDLDSKASMGKSGKFKRSIAKVKNFYKRFSRKGGRQKLLLLLLFVIMLLAIAIFLAKNKGEERLEIERLDGILDRIETNLSEAETQSAFDKENAKRLLELAENDAREVLASGYYRERAHLYLGEIGDVMDQIDDVERVSEPEVFIDLAGKKSSIDALGIFAVRDRLYVHDEEDVFEIFIDELSDPIDLQADEDVLAGTDFGSRQSIVYLTNGGRLIEYKDGNRAFMDSEEGTFRQGVALDDWSNNVYVLDPEGNQIWKYAYMGNRETFAAAQPYLGEGADFSSAVSLAIDASIYVLSSDGRITKLFAGEVESDFVVENQPLSMFEGPSEIYTNDELDHVYVIDSEQARIFSFRKDLKTGNIIYEKQLYFDKLNEEIRGIFIDAKGQRMYVLSESKIFVLDFQQ